MAIPQLQHSTYRPRPAARSAASRSPYAPAVGYPKAQERSAKPLALPNPQVQGAAMGIPRYISIPLFIAATIGLVVFVYGYSRLTDQGYKRVALGRQIHALEAQRNRLNELNTALADPERVRQWALSTGMAPAGEASVNLYPATIALPETRLGGFGDGRIQTVTLASASREGR